jgi:hypothetical protein
MKIYLVYECYFADNGAFKKVLKKLLKDKNEATKLMDDYPVEFLNWMEIEERNLE